MCIYIYYIYYHSISPILDGEAGCPKLVTKLHSCASSWPLPFPSSRARPQTCPASPRACWSPQAAPEGPAMAGGASLEAAKCGHEIWPFAKNTEDIMAYDKYKTYILSYLLLICKFWVGLNMSIPLQMSQKMMKWWGHMKIHQWKRGMRYTPFYLGAWEKVPWSLMTETTSEPHRKRSFFTWNKPKKDQVSRVSSCGWFSLSCFHMFFHVPTRFPRWKMLKSRNIRWTPWTPWSQPSHTAGLELVGLGFRGRLGELVMAGHGHGRRKRWF